MPAPEPHYRTQEQSIKARKHQLFETDEDHSQSAPRRSFAQCLRETPADPLSPTLKTSLWVVGTLVVLLLLAALAQSVTRKPRPRPRPTVGAGWWPDGGTMRLETDARSGRTDAASPRLMASEMGLRRG